MVVPVAARGVPGQVRSKKVAERARGNGGKFVDLATYATHHSAVAAAARIRRGLNRAFGADFEAVVKDEVVRVRFVG